MHTLTKTSLVGAAVTAVLGGVVGLSAPAQAASTVHGCPYGYVCVYPQDKGWNNDVPSLKFYTYGGHNLSNQLGNHYVLNNQHNALTIFCSSYGGCATSSTSQYQIGGIYYTWEENASSSWKNVNLTPVNSIDLEVQGP